MSDDMKARMQALLRDTMAAVEEGKIAALSLITIRSDGGVPFNFVADSKATCAALAGMTEYVKDAMLTALDDGPDEEDQPELAVRTLDS